MKRRLILEDGTVFEGEGFGATASTCGEVVFTTGMSGYQEVVTDQSFNGQIVLFTYPLIGNYGVNRDDNETITPTCKGVIVKEYARRPSNWRSQMSFDAFLKSHDIPGIAGIDTRKLTRLLRDKGTIKGSIVDVVPELDHDFDQLRATVLPKNQVEQVSTIKPYAIPGLGRNIAVLDCGLKHSILRELVKHQCSVTVLPYQTSASDILALNPDGVLLSNGPGDPQDIPEVIEMIKELQEHLPIFGICLGHQLLSLANGAKTYKLPFGHRGANHPVKDLQTGRIDFTAQNHSYAVDQASIANTELEVTHIELNDETIEGVKHKRLPAFSVQFHPDAAPGPHDALHLFDEFMELIDTWKEQQ